MTFLVFWPFDLGLNSSITALLTTIEFSGPSVVGAEVMGEKVKKGQRELWGVFIKTQTIRTLA